MMEENNRVGVLLYRYNNNELEVYLVGQNEDAKDQMALPRANDFDQMALEEELIPLEECKDTRIFDKAMAVEAKLEHCVKKFVHIQQEEGTYVAVKEAFKKILPAQYSYLKELQEILRDRNSVMNM